MMRFIHLFIGLFTRDDAPWNETSSVTREIEFIDISYVF
jgi:hypothetical protein